MSIPILLALGAVVGALNGALISYLRSAGDHHRLGTLFVLTGVGQQILLNPEQAQSNWTNHLGGKFGPVPGGLVTIVVPLLVWLVLRRTPFVEALFSVGDDDADGVLGRDERRRDPGRRLRAGRDVRRRSPGSR